MSHSPAQSRPPLPSAEEIAQLPPDGGPRYNRLVFEQSPYLLQHAANPVDWRPWGDAAFEEARKADKPIFLSIGYSTCHWCHVMEHESFEDADAARILNEVFIPIKVDREERPDIDHVYMHFCQATTGHGGWPLTVLLNHDREPFFAGTYFPKMSRGGRPGVIDLALGVQRAWRDNRADVEEQADDFARALSSLGEGAPGEALGLPILEAAQAQLARRFDAARGGFGNRPKFPTPHNMSFLLRRWKRNHDAQALAMVEKTLRGMWLGGVHDHVGGGFHRYSTDAEWLLPHFEKMLYDQAMMMIAATEAHQASGDPLDAAIVRDIASYVLRDLSAPEGGFHSAEDADSEGEEGLFYVWTEKEVRAILADDLEGADLFLRAYNFEKDGNFEDEATGLPSDKNIPHLKKTVEELAGELGQDPKAFAARMASLRRRLFEVREGRVRPMKDDKVLADWNGLMIAALAKASRALDEPAWADRAVAAAEFALAHLRDADGRLLKRWRQGKAGLPSTLDDHAFLAWGFLELYETTLDARWLREAKAMADEAIARFADEERGGFFLSAADGETPLARPKEIYDGAIPSGNSVMALTLARLARLTGDAKYEERARGVVTAFSAQVEQQPMANAMLMQAIDFLEGPTYEVVIVGERGAADTRAMLNPLRKRLLSGVVVLFKPAGETRPAVADVAPFTEGMAMVDGKAAAYVCENQSCQRPVTDALEMLKLLGEE